ncbi:PepSY-associated TM helix domain-containing protein [Reyranella sp.]|uniref:PepSY-associated TM helix domain-containing protein n=1 Tax=Reyranella sp. TaxID=1929291 RepID=UPI003BAD2DCB
MRSIRSLRPWVLVHKWASLVCTAFLLLICLTGLPLVFSHEIQDWLDPDPPFAELAAETPRVSLDDLIARARRLFPGEIVTSIFSDDDEPQVIVAMAPSWKASRDDPKSNHFIKFDARTAVVLEQSRPREERRRSFVSIMLRLHVDLFAGLPGALFMGAMGVLLVVSVVSGVVLYGPIARKIDFGEIRMHRPRRVRWLDIHNLLGIVTLAWALVVGATGVMNELSGPLFALWKRTDIDGLIAPWRGREPPGQADLVSVQAAFDTSRRALPGMVVLSAAFPGAELGSSHHFLIWAKGGTPLTSRLFSPVLVDARTGELTAVVRMPWYLRALEVSRPLHFGDYGGLPLKIIWALLDGVTIVVLGTGLYLWLSRRRSTIEARLAELEELGNET